MCAIVLATGWVEALVGVQLTHSMSLRCLNCMHALLHTAALCICWHLRQAVQSKDHCVQFYKNTGTIGLRRKSGDKVQWLSFGASKGWSEEDLRAKADVLFGKMNDGATEDEIVAYVREQGWKK